MDVLRIRDHIPTPFSSPEAERFPSSPEGELDWGPCICRRSSSAICRRRGRTQARQRSGGRLRRDLGIRAPQRQLPSGRHGSTAGPAAGDVDRLVSLGQPDLAARVRARRRDRPGRGARLRGPALAERPLHPSTKYVLRQFVTDHYSRRFATAAERWPYSLAFLERTLAAASAEAHQEEIAEFSAWLVREERAVENLVLRVLARPEEPHEAVADKDVVRRLNAHE